MALTLPVISGTKDSASASAGTGRPARRGLTRRGELKMSEGFVFPPPPPGQLHERGRGGGTFCSGAYRLRAAGPTATNTNGSHQTARREKHNPTSEIRPAEKQDVPPPHRVRPMTFTLSEAPVFRLHTDTLARQRQ